MRAASREYGADGLRVHGSCEPGKAGGRCSFLKCGVPHPGCFAQRVRKVLRRLEIDNLPMQKGA